MLTLLIENKCQGSRTNIRSNKFLFFDSAILMGGGVIPVDHLLLNIVDKNIRSQSDRPILSRNITYMIL